MKNGPPATRALLPDVEAAARGHGRRAIVLNLQILPNAVADLARLGWLP
jgi:hypothetical protein